MISNFHIINYGSYYIVKNKKNSIICIIGINGAGKSTIIKLIGRYYDVTIG